MRIQPPRAMAEERAVQCLPVTAMDEDDDRAILIARKEIDCVAGGWTVTQ